MINTHPLCARRSPLRLWLLLVPWLFTASPALSQQPGIGLDGARTISSIQFRGLARTNVAYVRDIVSVRPGDAVDSTALDDAVRRLLRTGKFASAHYRVEDEAGGARITFELIEHRTITAVHFEGNAKFRDASLSEQVGVKPGDAVDWFAIGGGKDAITAAYREVGYGDAVVTFDRQRVENTGELVYRIEEGVQTSVRKILFEGSTAFTDRQLLGKIETRKKFWIFRTGEFDADRAESDAASLQKFYRDSGFLDARASYRRELSDDGRSLTLVFTIVEGVEYAIEEIRFEGHTVFTGDELRDGMSSTVGATMRQPLIDRDVRAIQSKYWELGYIYATVRGGRVFSDKPGLATVIIQIDEQGQYRVGKIVVRGNTRTRDKVVRRALNLFPPDDLFDLNEAKEAERRLLETQIFETARVFPVGDGPDSRDAVLDVQEAERAGDVLFGLGVTSNSGVVGTLVVDLKNFDFSDRPRTWKEFIKFRSFFGGGQRLRLELQPGTEVNRFRIDFTEPYLWDKPLRFDFSGYFFERGRDGYNETRVGLMLSLGKRFERGRLHGWSGELALRIEGATVDELDLFASKEIRDDEGNHFSTSLKASLVRDRTDSRFVPTTGDRLRFSYEQFGILGGDLGFGRLGAAYTWYKTLRVDRIDRKSVLRLRAEGGVIAGDAPVFERYYAGGTGSLRGFRFRGVGPRDGLDKNNIGGDFLVLLSGEYAFPLIGENVRGHVFLDTGTAGAGAYRASIGVGIRLTVDLLGPLPLEFNLAAPIGADSDDDTQVFSFLIGSLF